jgi:hypothetical protein
VSWVRDVRHPPLIEGRRVAQMTEAIHVVHRVQRKQGRAASCERSLNPRRDRPFFETTPGKPRAVPYGGTA